MTNISNNLNDLRRYGVELELVSDLTMDQMINKIYNRTGVRVARATYSDKTNRWRMKPDCSVRGRNGMELVTPILHGEADMDTLKSVVAVLEEFGEVNRSCGMHVHVDITGAEATPLKKLMKFFAKYEKAIGNLISESRRGSRNHYCADHFYGYEYLNAEFEALNGKTVSQLLSRSKFAGRNKWNFMNYSRHGSVENRAHQGTLNQNKVEHWVRLTQSIVEVAFKCRGQVSHVGDTLSTYGTDHMLNQLKTKGAISSQTKSFYKTRLQELN